MSACHRGERQETKCFQWDIVEKKFGGGGENQQNPAGDSITNAAAEVRKITKTKKEKERKRMN